MLHLGILPNHHTWGRLFRNLRYVVLDEAHVYRGVFGSHVANTIRRLRRPCRQYGSAPQIIHSSPTIASPVEMAEAMDRHPTTVPLHGTSTLGEPRFISW